MIDGATRKAILIGLVSGTLVVYVVRPAIDHIPGALLKVAAATSQRYLDSIYFDAAQPSASMEPLTFYVLGLLSLLSVVWLGNLSPSTMAKPLRAFLGVFLLVLAVLSFYGGFTETTRTALARCFHTRIAVLSPYLPDQATRELLAGWTLMQSQADFQALNKRLEVHAKHHNIPRLLKSLEGPNQGPCL